MQLFFMVNMASGVDRGRVRPTKINNNDNVVQHRRTQLEDRPRTAANGL